MAAPQGENLPEKFLQTVEFATKTLSHALTDFDLSKSHGTPVYNLDFSILVSTLFPAPGEGSRDFDIGTKEAASFLFEKQDHREPFILAVSGVFFYEFLDQLNHSLNWLETEVPKLYDIPEISTSNVNAYIDNLFKDTQDLKRSLLGITSHGVANMIEAPCNHFLRLLEEQKIFGIGDYLKQSRPTPELQNIFSKIYADQKGMRQRRETRRPEHREFHYKMDAVNICMTLYCSRELHSSALFVTPSFANLKSCYRLGDGKLFGRHYLVPVAVKNLRLMEDSGYVHDCEGYLRDAIAVGEDLRKRLARYADGATGSKRLPGSLLTAFESYYKDYYERCLQTASVSPSPDLIYHEEELRQLLASKRARKERVDAALAESERMVRKITERTETLGLDTMRIFNLEDDPILKEIKRRFKI